MPKTSRKRAHLRSVVPDHNPCNRVLISTEGTKTEPRYFNKLNKLLGRCCFTIVPNSGNESSPNRVLQRLQSAIKNPKYDYNDSVDVACLIMDVDKHTTLKKTVQLNNEGRGRPAGPDPNEQRPLVNQDETFGTSETTVTTVTRMGHGTGFVPLIPLVPAVPVVPKVPVNRYPSPVDFSKSPLFIE